MHDPDLHLFLDDREITVRQNLYRMLQTARRESTQPVLAATELEEGSALGYATTVRDAASGEYRIWYSNHGDALVRHAVSADCLTWERRGRAGANGRRQLLPALHVVPGLPVFVPLDRSRRLEYVCARLWQGNDSIK